MPCLYGETKHMPSEFDIIQTYFQLPLLIQGSQFFLLLVLRQNLRWAISNLNPGYDHVNISSPPNGSWKKNVRKHSILEFSNSL